MRPYYEERDIKIYLGDCREVLPQLERVDLVLTDPPYGIKESSRSPRSDGGALKAGRNSAPHQSKGIPSRIYERSNWDDSICQEGIDISISKAEISIIFGGNFYSLPPSSCWLVWDKDNGFNDFADCELAWTNLNKAVRKFRWQWCGMIQETQDKRRAEVRVHPTQKPLALMKWCIKQAGNPQSIIDPFMGSGTTLRAAKDLGLQATGIEISEAYCEIAAKRLAQEVFQFEEIVK